MNTPMLPTPPDCGAPCAMCESYAHLLAKAREESAIRGLTLATLCDMLLGEDATDRSDDALVRAAWKLKQDLERFTGGGLLDCHAICDQRDTARAENHALREEIARLKEIADHNEQLALKNSCEVARLRDRWAGWLECVDSDGVRLAAFPKYSLAKDYADGTDCEIRPVGQMANGGAE